ncbi:hypothetical protein METBIDRAFT_39112 [Metschnikowia bicuspidata var. bicuspidata NRRL YB-4993]|uniref:UDP-N-acetylglucosamine transferase subunit ALG13 n=1 Tax=Metschnikowia bicuspidata var. bicuspidata NRRL YB-4993 TaxID=869754 RepID=A0A1A0HD49_9ASCO|nr:hypothetical protein METBIDRAFT_39112 [Metschnikowia bicuspidata var. bicuspidata NRRL YB-4993]OBA21895.1 hypothetical protein METBIDRAFT_39112 [Metschnikowia bicuspidata var. bicuspidata NRRL YB-4993]
MSILFTSGATVTFRPFLDEIVTVSFLLSLQKSGFSTVALQYGNETNPDTGSKVSKEYFSQLLADRQIVQHLDFELVNETNDKSVTVFRSPTLTLQVFGFSDDIGSYIRSADLVVSHAGTGSILDTLRLKKPLIVVTNESLMDNHQAEIAARFEKEKYLAKVSVLELAQGMLRDKIGRWKNGDLHFELLPEPPAGVLGHVISEELCGL